MGNGGDGGTMILLLGGGCVCCVCVIVIGLAASYFLLPSFKAWVDGLLGISSGGPSGDTPDTPSGPTPHVLSKLEFPFGGIDASYGSSVPSDVFNASGSKTSYAADKFKNKCARNARSPSSIYKSTRQNDAWQWVQQVDATTCTKGWAVAPSAGKWVCPPTNKIQKPADPKDTPWCISWKGNFPAAKLPKGAILGTGYRGQRAFTADGGGGLYGPCSHDYYRKTFAKCGDSASACDTKCESGDLSQTYNAV